MVQTEIRPDNQAENIDRPVGRSFYADSRLFFVSNTEIMPQHYGMVAQVAYDRDTHSVLLDAREYEDQFIWQHTVARGNQGSLGRTTTHFEVTSDGQVQAWQAEFNNQGQLQSVIDLGDWTEPWSSIKTIIKSPAAQSQRQRLYENQAQQNKLLSKLVWDNRVGADSETIFAVSEVDYVGEKKDLERDEKGKIIVRIAKKLDDQELAKEIEKREELIQKIGFVLIAPMSRPENVKTNEYYNQGRLLSPEVMQVLKIKKPASAD